MTAQPHRRRRSPRMRTRVRQPESPVDALVRALQQVYANVREDATLAALRQRMGR